MNCYLLRCEYNGHRTWRGIKVSLSCTRDEMLAELCRKTGANPLHVVAMDVFPTMGVVNAHGAEWMRGKP